MLRRTILKILGAVIAAPVIGWPVRRVVRWSKWNLWIGGDDGAFDNPRNWSHGRVPKDGESFVLNTGNLVLPEDSTFDNIITIGSGTLIVVGSNKEALRCLDSLTISDDFKGTIGKQGRPL